MKRGLLFSLILGISWLSLMPTVYARSAPPTPFLYFSELIPSSNISQLRVRDTAGSAHNLFTAENDGVFQAISPNGDIVSFLRWDWDAPQKTPIQFWLGDIS